MASTEYHKIWSPFNREVQGTRRGKLIMGQWSLPEIRLLSDSDWTWTEKVNGTNVRIIWDGHKVTVGGRTDDAQMPLILVRALQAQFTEELLEQQFHATPAVLYGEGYGARVQAGSGVYSPDPRFVMFDAKVDGWWLLPDALEVLALQMAVDIVPTVFTGHIVEAVALVRGRTLKSRWGDFAPEGLVGKPPLGLTRRDGDRILVKIKGKDFL
jgi:hypothetical protein